MKILIFRMLAVLAGIASIALFLVNLIVIQIDAQGALILIFTVPLIAGFCLMAYLLFSRDQGAWRRAGRIAVVSFGLVQALFLADLIAVGGKLWAGGMIRQSTRAFKWFTGYGPYAYFRYDRMIQSRLETQVADAAKRGEVAASDFAIDRPWVRVCLMGPYLDEKQVTRILGYWSAGTLDRTRATMDDRYVAVAFMDANGSAFKILDVERSRLDLAEIGGRCYAPEQIRFRVEVAEGGRRVARTRSE